MRVLEVIPIQPLSFSVTAIGGAEFFTLTRSMAIPLPTTILGALGTLNNVRLGQVEDAIDTLKELYSKFTDMLKCSEPVIIGPLLRFKLNEKELGTTYVHLYPDKFSPVDKIKVVIKDSDESVVIEECSDADDIIYDPLIRIGVSLERRSLRPDSWGEAGKKIIKYGYMYKYPLAIYRTRDGKIVEPIYTYLLNCEGDVKTGLVRFGGEGRATKINLHGSSSPELAERIKSPLNELDEGYYVALSQIPLLPLTKESVLILKAKKFEMPINEDGVMGIPQVRGPPKIRVERLGLGFSEVTKKRRPQILALPPGTIIKVAKRWTGEHSHVMRTLLRLGFSSLYKLG